VHNFVPVGSRLERVSSADHCLRTRNRVRHLPAVLRVGRYRNHPDLPLGAVPRRLPGRKGLSALPHHSRNDHRHPTHQPQRHRLTVDGTAGPATGAGRCSSGPMSVFSHLTSSAAAHAGPPRCGRQSPLTFRHHDDNRCPAADGGAPRTPLRFPNSENLFVQSALTADS